MWEGSSMEGRNAEMEAIFSELSEKNKEIVILVAKSIKVAQEAAEQPSVSPKTSDSTGGASTA